MKDKYIVLVVGESGSGKSTICNLLTTRYGLKQVESYTTRPMRYEGESGHTFVNDAEFDALDNMCAYTVFDGYKYGATQEQVDNADLYVIDFFYFRLIDFPIFNVADIYVTVAAFAMFGLGLFYYKDEDYDLIFPSKKDKGKKNYAD